MSASSRYFGHNTPLAPTKTESKYRFVFPLLIMMIAAALVFSLLTYLNDAVRFPVARVEVGGKLVYTDRQQLMQIVKAHTRKGFFGLSLEEIRVEVLALPWVENAAVRRVFPNRLHVATVERKAAVQWNDGGLIDEAGSVFYPPQLSSQNADVHAWHERFVHLPHLRGVDERSRELQDTLVKYQSLLGPDIPKLLGVYEDDRRSQTLLLGQNIIVRLGYEQLEYRLKRFQSLFEKYVNSKEFTDVQFDMRYTNGFTVAGIGENLNNNAGYN